MGLFEDYYDELDLDKNSEYSHMSKKELVIEAEYLHNSLWNILKYVDNHSGNCFGVEINYKCSETVR